MKNVGGPDDLPEGTSTHFFHVASGLMEENLVRLLSYSRTFSSVNMFGSLGEGATNK